MPAAGAYWCVIVVTDHAQKCAWTALYSEDRYGCYWEMAAD